MNNANATRAATCPDDIERADLPAAAINIEATGAEARAPLLFDPAPPEELVVVVAYLQGELSHRFFRLVEKFMEALHG